MYNKKNIFEIFESVSSKYDLMNNIMSLGIHHIWKNIFVNKIEYFEKIRLIDVACGTGDIINFFQKKKHNNNHFIIGCDPNFEMLKVCKDKMINKGIIANLVCCEAENLPFKDNIFNVYTISFGIRNVYNIQKSLDEAYRILEKGGQFLCMEFGIPDNFLISNLYDFYSRIIPFIGDIITNNKDAYRYLIESIRSFPKIEDFKKLILKSGFEDIEVIKLSQGIVNIFIAWK